MIRRALVTAGPILAAAVGVLASADFITRLAASLKFGSFELAERSAVVLLAVAGLASAACMYKSTPLQAIPRAVGAMAGVVLLSLFFLSQVLGTTVGLLVNVKPYGALLVSGALSALAGAAHFKAVRAPIQRPLMAAAGAGCTAAVLLWVIGAAALLAQAA